MSYTVTSDSIKTIAIMPEDVVQEVLQNVAMLLCTPKGSLPLARGMGMDNSYIDMPMLAAEHILMAEILELVEEYEPRAEIKDATITKNNETGKLTVILEVEINEDSGQDIS